MRWNSLHGHVRMHIITPTQSLESLPPPAQDFLYVEKIIIP